MNCSDIVVEKSCSSCGSSEMLSSTIEVSTGTFDVCIFIIPLIIVNLLCKEKNVAAVAITISGATLK